jgi:hypothetical protein|tara:strand:- start:43 stop:195 length:153 start_codon:yes stop_codon:yes gene_type:complete
MKNDIVLGDGTRQTEKNKTVPNGIWSEFAEEEMFNNIPEEEYDEDDDENS